MWTAVVIDPVQGDDGLTGDFMLAVGWYRRGEFGDDGAFSQNRIYGIGFLKNAALPHMVSYPKTGFRLSERLQIPLKRRRWDSNPRIMDLQSIALATWPRRLILRNLGKGCGSVKIGRI